MRPSIPSRSAALMVAVRIQRGAQPGAYHGLANPSEHRHRVIGESSRARVISAAVRQTRHFQERCCFIVTSLNLAGNGKGFVQILGR
jgi:hypothetical protein